MIKTMDWRGNVLVLLDQTKLPDIIDFIACYDYRRVAQAIRSMEVRGAPAIGVAAAFAMVLGYKEIRMHGLSGTDVLKELDPKVIAYEESFSRNLNTEEINQLNHLLEKYRNK